MGVLDASRAESYSPRAESYGPRAGSYSPRAPRRMHGFVADKRPAVPPGRIVGGPTAAERRVADTRTAGDRLTRRLLRAFTSLRRWEAGLLRAEAAHVDYLSGGDRCQALGFSSIADLCRETLGWSERSVRERITLHRVLAANVQLDRPFMRGKLTVCQVLALAPVARGVEDDESRAWIARARRLTVRELQREVRGRQPGAYHEERHSRKRFIVDAPVEIRAAFDEFVGIGQMVVGYDAPIGEVVEAALAETGRAGVGVTAPDRGAATLGAVPSPSARRRASFDRLRLVRSAGPLAPQDAAEAEEVVRDLLHLKRRLATFFDSHLATRMHDGRLHPRTALDHLEELRALHNPLRVMKSRLIRSMRGTRCDTRLGFATTEEFVADRLDLSPRSARELVTESYIFEHHPPLEKAYAEGRIGITKARLIRRMASGGDIEKWIDRAEAVLHRSFERECRLLELVRQYDPRIARTCGAGPFPHFGMERILFDEVRAKQGLKVKELERELKIRGVRRLPARSSLDPAMNPPLMRRLEVLALLLCTSAQDPAVAPNRRQMFAVQEPHALLGFGCSDEVLADLRALYRDFDHAHGPLTQPWVPFILMMKEACDAWRLQDPERIPTHEALLRRDAYHCAFPGCSRRRTLEVNHIHFRSRGGSGRSENLTTLCFTHHRGVFHTGYARIAGEAPHALRYEIGICPGRPPLLVTLGNYILERNGKAVGLRRVTLSRGPVRPGAPGPSPEG